MFKPTSAKDRINYGEVLMPPAGYKFEKAVGTTYSLNLETLTAISISLGLVEDTDSELIRNPISMLLALQKVSDKITLFCEAGQIKRPSKPNALCSLLERMVVTVKLPFDRKINRYPSFHPKMWLVEYKNKEGDLKYRLVVMSRNMTFDHNWDVACALDGYISENEDSDSDNIALFLDFLKRQIDNKSSVSSNHIRDIDYFIKALETIKFECDERFSTFSFLPLGIGEMSYDMNSDELFTERFDDLIVMSPFISGSVIQGFNSSSMADAGASRILITRKAELSSIADGQASNFDVYVMKDDIVDGESVISDGENIEVDQDDDNTTDANVDEVSSDEVYRQDIHAKLYLRRVGRSVDLYLGSMNASYAALHSNVETVLYLNTSTKYYDTEKFLNDIMGEDRESKRNPFELVVPKLEDIDDNQNIQDKAEQQLKRICRYEMKAAVTENSSKYNVSISVDMKEKSDNVTIHPLLSRKESNLDSLVIFESLDKIQLSEFYVISVRIDDYSIERVIMIPTVGIPDDREAEIIKSVVKDRKSFIEYVSFILGDDYVRSFLENKNASGGGIDWNTSGAMPAIYEKMLKTSLSDRDRIGDIKYITQLVEEEDIIPKEFRDMYQVFCDTLNIK